MSSMEDFDDFGGYTVNYDKVINSKDCLAVTRLLAAQVSKTPYMKVGDFFQNISDSDLDTLVKLADEDDGENFDDFCLIGEMLAAAEGLAPSDSLEDIHQRITQTISFVIVESLARKKLVKIHYENMSFGEDMAKKLLVEKLV